ncbi:N-acetylmuramoyl-L-alanine amidase [Thermosipho sp. (in: thermotogales)]|jgi:N-acetylmuramoyl-L-alanine amidase|uniref:N-acetylmuramoyl-L-alanine amidase family protein n=1 Tax=Thermosipho sp. (in: thermotogales) TaxID=1968895 RepID=UPI00257A977D|nr:N-acetylmuramoyl-L-alanine amidase [Thermosipho sp. (in: thermotogales)]MBZ4649162.1 N-acetylmuramoyl-L-alanine amidase [Thermosipho sp. (in: thermotogales)]
MFIIIDAGHGGVDPGAIGPQGLKEKDVNLSIALKLGRKLSVCGVKIDYTRVEDDPHFPTDERENLAKRVSIANTAKADFFVSIHCNGNVESNANGIETYCWKLGGEAEKLAKSVQENLVKATGLKNRGVKTANFYVIKYTLMPAILVETAFITNPIEEKLLSSDEFRDKLACSITKGICEYLKIKYIDENTFQDVSSWALEAWKWGIEDGIIDGIGPKRIPTREEIVTMLYRYKMLNK